MHHALGIPEILLNIFSFCCPHSDGEKDYNRRNASQLASLARTCRAFKEPALDILWKHLPVLSPLARCLPEASYQSSQVCYSFRRPLTLVEWDTLWKYASRIRSIGIGHIYHIGLCRKSLITLSNSPKTKTRPLFPNVRRLCFYYSHSTKSVLLLSFPSLTSLDVNMGDTRFFTNSLKLLARTSPTITRLSIQIPTYQTGCIDASFICWWKALQIVDCRRVCLDANALVHLSRMPSLVRLGFMLHSALLDQIPPSKSSFTFSTLDDLIVESHGLDAISRLISQNRLPVVTKVSASVQSQVSKQDLSSFFTSIQTSGVTPNVQKLSLDDSSLSACDRLVLGFQDLQPCMAFGHLRYLNLNLPWGADLTDGALLKLASAWPHLEALFINQARGWSGLGGIMPGGVLQLLLMCPSLSRIALVLDTRGCTDVPLSSSSFGLVVSQVTYFNVLDSVLEPDSVAVVAAFLSGILADGDASIVAWKGKKMKSDPHGYAKRWKEVSKTCQQLVARRIDLEI